MKEARPTAFRHRVMVYPYLTCLLSFNCVLVKVARNVRLQSGLGVWSYQKRTTRRPNPTFPGVGYVCERLRFCLRANAGLERTKWVIIVDGF